jgi:DNA-binding GntR family transcriptional regulator
VTLEQSTASGKSFCIDDVKRRILTLELKPSEYLDEVELGDAYGISRPPVREALRQLSGEGFVVLHEKRGAQVAPMTHTTLRNFFVAAPMLYAAVARLAAQYATAPHLERLKDIQKSFRAAIEKNNVAQRALLNEQFHATIGEMADNEYLMPSLRRLLIDHTRISMTFYDPRQTGLAKVQAIAADQHDQLIALIASGNADAAAELAIAHWELSRTEFEKFVSPESIRAPLGEPPGLKQKGEA